jgi:CHASE1-domain containing sensor protein
VALLFSGVVVSDRVWGEPSWPLTLFGCAFVLLAWPASVVMTHSFLGFLALVALQGAVVGAVIATAVQKVRTRRKRSPTASLDAIRPDRA